MNRKKEVRIFLVSKNFSEKNLKLVIGREVFYERGNEGKIEEVKKSNLYLMDEEGRLKKLKEGLEIKNCGELVLLKGKESENVLLVHKREYESDRLGIYDFEKGAFAPF